VVSGLFVMIVHSKRLVICRCLCDRSTTLRTIVCDELANHLVFPNKISVSLMDHTGPASLLFDMPKVCSHLPSI